MRLISRISIACVYVALAANTAAQTNTALMKSMNDMMGRIRLLKMTGSFDADFAKLMVEHHQGAIDMAQAYLASGDDAQLKAHAKQVIDKRKKEQKQLDIFTMSKSGTGSDELRPQMEQAVNQMRGIKSAGNINADFAMMMVAHYDSGSAIAQKEVTRGQNAALKKLAASLAEDYRQGKELLSQWLKTNKK